MRSTAGGLGSGASYEPLGDSELDGPEELWPSPPSPSPRPTVRQRSTQTTMLSQVDAPIRAHGRVAARPSRPRARNRWRKLTVAVAALAGFFAGAALGHSVFLSVIRAIVWFGYHLWNPGILSIIRAIVWFGYHLWNPAATDIWHRALEVLRDLITAPSMADLVRSVIATLTATLVIQRINRRREINQTRRHPSSKGTSRTSGRGGAPDLPDIGPGAARTRRAAFAKAEPGAGSAGRRAA
jgi:hypothetical protein